MMSMAVPGVIGATTVISRFGNCSCARAGPHRQAAASVIAASFENVMASSSPSAVSAVGVLLFQ